MTKSKVSKNVLLLKNSGTFFALQRKMLRKMSFSVKKNYRECILYEKRFCSMITHINV